MCDTTSANGLIFGPLPLSERRLGLGDDLAAAPTRDRGKQGAVSVGDSMGAGNDALAVIASDFFLLFGRVLLAEC